MCAIAGFFNPVATYTENMAKAQTILKEMNRLQVRRGPDESGMHIREHFALAHDRLSIIDLSTGQQPMIKTINGKEFGIVYNGEIYNMHAIKTQLQQEGWQFCTSSDTEVILVAYLAYGYDFVTKLNGIFAFAIMDEAQNQLVLYRDRSGIKPLFYTFVEHTLVFSSELKGLFAYPGVTPRIDKNGLNEIFSIGPAKTYGCGVFYGVEEVLPAHYMIAGRDGVRTVEYWRLESHPHEDSFAKTVETTAFLVQDAIRLQMLSDVPICTFLSGGIDSSVVSAVCANELAAQGKQLNTFSFDFTGNSKYFSSSAFQPSEDRPYVDKMVEFLGTNHTYLECDKRELADYLYQSVDARDLPAMADIDSSLLYFCGIVKKYNKVVLTGECADEIFGGYPWFHKKEFFERNTFPWTPSLQPRKDMLRDDFLNVLHMDEYVQAAYEKSVAETPRLPGENPEAQRRREIAYLNLKWFMQTLLDRMDRTSMYSGLEARVPFADHRIIEYVWNVPWEMKTCNGLVKGLLREASRGLVPDEILFRKKSPYPKIYDPAYEQLLRQRLMDVLASPHAPLLNFVDKEKVMRMINRPSDYGKPWYGQLMAAPQMLAYLLQVNYWLEKYKVEILL